MKTKTSRLAPALVVVGALLATFGLFAPRYRLYTTFGDTPGERSVAPWTALHDGVVAPVSMALGVFPACRPAAGE